LIDSNVRILPEKKGEERLRRKVKKLKGGKETNPKK